MALESNIGSSIRDIESIASSNLIPDTEIESIPSSKPQLRSKIHQFCRLAPEGEERDSQGKLLYYCKQCEYKTNATSITTYLLRLCTSFGFALLWSVFASCACSISAFYCLPLDHTAPFVPVQSA